MTSSRVQALVLCPTRELADQVGKENQGALLQGTEDKLIELLVGLMTIKTVPGTIAWYNEGHIAHASNLKDKEQKTMSKGQDSKKTAKKEPAKTPKEKKADKKIKKDEKKK